MLTATALMRQIRAAVIGAFLCVSVVLLWDAGLPAQAHAATASWSFEPASLDFGIGIPNSGPSPAKALTLTNTGEVELRPGFFAIGGEAGARFAIVADSCGPLAPGASCVIEVTFEPETAGRKESELSVGDLNHPGTFATADLSGTGAGPAASVLPSTLVFDPLPVGAASSTRSVTVTNEGQLDMVLSSMSIGEEQIPDVPGADSEQFRIAGGTCAPGLVVAPGASCTVEVIFSPSVPGVLQANLGVFDNAPRSPQVVPLFGKGIAMPGGPPPVSPSSPPTVTLFRSPPKVTTRRAATFWFRGSGGAAGFRCRLDHRPFAACTSPRTYRHLSLGPHAFTVVAIDAAGNRSLGPATSRFRVKRPGRFRG